MIDGIRQQLATLILTARAIDDALASGAGERLQRHELAELAVLLEDDVQPALSEFAGRLAVLPFARPGGGEVPEHAGTPRAFSIRQEPGRLAVASVGWGRKRHRASPLCLPLCLPR